MRNAIFKHDNGISMHGIFMPRCFRSGNISHELAAHGPENGKKYDDKPTSKIDSLIQ